MANISHPLYPDIKNILMKHIGIDKIVDNVVKKLGKVKKVFISGDFAKGIDNKIIDLLFVGNDINKSFLIELIEKVERKINRKIRYVVFNENEFREYKHNNKDLKHLLIWEE